MHLHSSILLLVTEVDGLQVTNDHLYATHQLSPLFLYCLLPRQAKEYGKSVLGGAFFMPRDSRPIIFIMGRHLRQLIATFLICVGRMCVFSLSFLHIEFISFFIKKPSHILLLRYTLSLEFETKGKFLHLPYGKTHFPPLMVDFDFIKKEILIC